jgi:hypothetical protein
MYQDHLNQQMDFLINVEMIIDLSFGKFSLSLYLSHSNYQSKGVLMEIK